MKSLSLAKSEFYQRPIYKPVKHFEGNGEFLIILKGLLIIRYHKPPFVFGNLPFFCFLNCIRAGGMADVTVYTYDILGCSQKSGSLKQDSCSVQLSSVCAKLQLGTV